MAAVSLEAFASLVVSMKEIISIQQGSVRRLSDLEARPTRACSSLSGESITSRQGRNPRRPNPCGPPVRPATFKTNADSFMEAVRAIRAQPDRRKTAALRASDLDGYFNAARTVQAGSALGPRPRAGVHAQVEESFYRLRELLWVETSNARSSSRTRWIPPRTLRTAPRWWSWPYRDSWSFWPYAMIIATVRSITRPIRGLEKALALAGAGDLRQAPG